MKDGYYTHAVRQDDQFFQRCSYTTSIVNDMDESTKFYKDVLGFEVDSQYHPPIPGSLITLMKSKRGDAMVELILNPQIHYRGLYSVGMDVKNLVATLEDLKTKGVKIISGPTPTTNGSLALEFLFPNVSFWFLAYM